MGPPATPSAKRRWLILSHAFNVDGRAESLTITDKIPHLIAAGIEPIVMSSLMGTHDKHITHIQCLPWGPAGIRFDLRHVLARRWGRGLKYRLCMLLITLPLAPLILIERLLLGLRSQWSWAIAATLRGWRFMRRGDVELVYSTGGMFSAHLAGYWLKRLTGCRWIAEVHDPMLAPGKPPRGRHERFLAHLESCICKYADVAWWFTDGALNAARQRHPMLASRAIVILPGAEPPVVHAKYQAGSLCVLGHFGSLSPTRSLAPLLQAIASLLHKNPELRNTLRLEVYGSKLDPQAQHLMQSLGLADVVLPMGRLEFNPKSGLSGRAQVMQRMQQVDVLVMLHGHIPDCAEYIPSKLYEYFWARRPVLALTHQNRQLDELVLTHGGWVAETTDALAVESALHVAIQTWHTRGLPEVTLPPVTVANAVQRILEAVGHV